MDTLPNRKTAVMAKLRAAQDSVRWNANPQTYSHEYRGRAAAFVALVPVFDAVVRDVEAATTRGQARCAIRAALQVVRSGFECNMLMRALEMVG